MSRSHPIRAWAARRALVALALLTACAGSEAKTGCVRVSQDGATVPGHRMLSQSVSLRVTEQGAQALADTVRDAIALLFGVNEAGHAILPMESLGVGAVTTALGPFDLELRDGVLALDLSQLAVQLVPGSSPARLLLTLEDADTWLLAGTVAGTVGVGVLAGDAACGLTEGPSGRLARLSMTLEVTVDTGAGGVMDLSIVTQDVHVEDVDVTVELDCGLTECLDGCGECEVLCGNPDLTQALVASLQGTLGVVVDELAVAVTESLANDVLDRLLNDKPLAIEGELDLARLAGPWLPTMASVEPIAVAVTPSTGAFRVTAETPPSLDVWLDAGFHPRAIHPCVVTPAVTETIPATAPPPWPSEATLPGGSLVPYDVGMRWSGRVVEQALAAALTAGVLCLELTSSDIANLTGGDTVVSAASMALILPGLVGLTGPDAPLRLSVQPRQGSSPQVDLTDSPEGATLTVSLPDSTIALAFLLGDHPVQVLSLELDLVLQMVVEGLEDARLGIRLAGLETSDLVLGDEPLFAAAGTDLVVPFVLDLLMGVLHELPLSLDLNIRQLVSAMTDLPLVPAVREILTDDGWLVVLVGLEDPLAAPIPLEPDGIEILSVSPGKLSMVVDAAPGHEVQVRVVGGGWGPWKPADTVVELASPRLWLLGAAAVEARLRDPMGRVGLAATVARVHVTAPPSPATQTDPTLAAAPRGCEGAGSSPRPLVWLLALGVMIIRFRPRSWAPHLACILLVACSGDLTAPPVPCQGHEQCPDGYVCGEDGLCAVATPCADDGACCPGSTCFAGWCRPRPPCGPERPCEGVDRTCELKRCVAAACTVDRDCHMGRLCISGRCASAMPCGGCAPGVPCHLPTGRCLPLVTCEASCPGERIPLLTGTMDPLTCAEAAWPCVCLEPSPVAPPMPGFEGLLLSLPGTPTMVSYDPRHGDLVSSRLSPTGVPAVHHALDGVPDVAPTGPPDSYRGGVAEPGPDRGHRPSATWHVQDGVQVIDVLHRDSDLGMVHHVRARAQDGAVLARGTLPIVGDAGRYSCLTRRPSDGALVGWVFVARDPTGSLSRLVRVEAQVGASDGAQVWTVTTVLETPLPLSAWAPCDGACQVGELCVRMAPGDDRCVSTFEVPTCPESCAAHQLCVAPEAGAQGECRPRVLPETSLDHVPYGRGLYVTCAADDEHLAVAWFDADAGALYALRTTTGAGSPTLVDGTPEAHDAPRVGDHVRASFGDDGALVLAYHDGAVGALKVARQDGGGAPWQVEYVHGHQGAALFHDLGAWPSLIHGPGDEPVVVYGDGSEGTIWLARRHPSGCWDFLAVYGDDTFAWPGIAPSSGGRVFVSALRLALDATLAVNHRLELVEIPLPDSDCEAPESL